jgi:hypothetical protein
MIAGGSLLRHHSSKFAPFFATFLAAGAFACASSGKHPALDASSEDSANGGASTGGTSGGGSATGGATGSGGVTGSGGATATGGSTGTAPVSDVPLIVVDQFGYLPGSEKIAVIRDPQTGFDSATDFVPGSQYALVDSTSDAQVFTAAPAAWNGGAVHAQSGDKAYWFDFTSVQTLGSYYVLDIEKNQRSPVFRIASDVYKPVLRHALRTFFYQRVGQAKQSPFAEAAWADGASHVGALQDHNARRYNAKTDATTERDVWGGWYDAGDYNKYTGWTASYVVEM